MVPGTINSAILVETEAKPSEEDNVVVQGETVIEVEQRIDVIPIAQVSTTCCSPLPLTTTTTHTQYTLSYYIKVFFCVSYILFSNFYLHF